MKVINILNKHERTSKGQTFTQPSQTIPDQTMSMRTILERYARGLPIAGSKEAIWSEDESEHGINPRTLDLVDFQELKMKNKAKIEELENEIKQSKKAKKQETIQEPEGH